MGYILTLRLPNLYTIIILTKIKKGFLKKERSSDPISEVTLSCNLQSTLLVSLCIIFSSCLSEDALNIVASVAVLPILGYIPPHLEERPFWLSASFDINISLKNCNRSTENNNICVWGKIFHLLAIFKVFWLSPLPPLKDTHFMPTPTLDANLIYAH